MSKVAPIISPTVQDYNVAIQGLISKIGANLSNRNLKGLSKERYGRLAERYVHSDTHARGEDLDRLYSIGDPQRRWQALDIATGGGHTALRFAPSVAHITITDIAPAMLKAAAVYLREQGVTNADYRIVDAEDLQFPSDSFDLITCRLAIHHFPHPTRFFQEAARVLRPGGYLLTQDHCAPEDPIASAYLDAFETLRDPSHHRTLRKSDWKQQYRDAAFQIVGDEMLMKRHNLSEWARRQDCDDGIIERLDLLLARAPKIAHDWVEPRALRSPHASFGNRNLILKGRLKDPSENSS